MRSLLHATGQREYSALIHGRNDKRAAVDQNALAGGALQRPAVHRPVTETP